MAVNLHSTHFRFGIDELAEGTHGWHANEDANPAQGVIDTDTTFLLRFTVQETGATAAGNVDSQFQCRKNTGTWQNITTTSSIAKAVAAAALTNGGNCTKRLGGTGTFESSGAGQTEDGLSGGNANDIAASGNSETECGLQILSADLAGGDVVEFRLTSPDFTITNDVVPSITVSGPTIVEADGAATGAATDSVIGRAVWAGVTAAAGVAADAVVAVALWAGVASSAGVAADSVVSGATAGSTASSAGVTTVDGQGEAGGGSDAAAAGTSEVSGVTAAIAAAGSSASGVGTISGIAAGFALADGSAPGTGLATGVGVSTAQADAFSAGASTPTGIGAALFLGTGQADGLAALSGLSASVIPGVGSGPGTATADAVSGVVSGSVTASAGVGSVTGDGAALLKGITKDSAGAPLGGCTVKLFLTSDDTCQGWTTSDESGNYTLTLPVAGPFFIVARKAGVAGTTVNTLAGP